MQLTNAQIGCYVNALIREDVGVIHRSVSVFPNKIDKDNFIPRNSYLLIKFIMVTVDGDFLFRYDINNRKSHVEVIKKGNSILRMILTPQLAKLVVMDFVKFKSLVKRLGWINSINKYKVTKYLKENYVK